MKKIKYILLILVFIVTGCRKDSFVLNDFIEKATDNAYIVKSDKTGYEEHEYIKKIYYAINRENAYDIQFLELENIDYAKQFFLLNANEIKSVLTENDYIKSRSYNTYEFFHAENETSYYIVIRSNNNIIYIDAPIDYINEIEEFLEDLDIDY